MVKAFTPQHSARARIDGDVFHANANLSGLQRLEINRLHRKTVGRGFLVRTFDENNPGIFSAHIFLVRPSVKTLSLHGNEPRSE